MSDRGEGKSLARHQYRPGPPEVTIWSNVDHVWIEIDGRDWGTADSNFSHGPGYGPQRTEGFLPSHPPGL
jgi:hypothetical protein